MAAPLASAGGVDLRAAANAALTSRWAKPVVFTLALVPLVWTVWLAYTGELGAEPVLESVKASGLWALRFLLIALALTPLRMLTGVAGLARFRRMLGLFAFFYAAVHLSTYVGLDQFFDWPAIWKEIVKRPYITVGMGAFLILTALAATSTDGMVKRLGGKRWRALHKAVFVAGLAGCLHFIMLVKGWQTAPLVYALICIGLLAFRRWPIRLGQRKDGRRKEAPVRTRPAAALRSGEAPAPHFPDGSSPVRRS
ncbi:sulfoxide reductase heme-binding subunit YedZ [Azospirillum melinis]|uniref:Protein-methionine-sulfoxide reductase heme-binding subunit MsrQ n=1 Tax=Azospirillum melinis TaxID=328839 RepID=A0ABX2KI42_9PROT|nr:protein-methionine-sulfoxide reductase heme-binding subunit MsrQ [Azospirillum melinis]MBP2306710.1 sulfoxide reductase heme-binding subunit YedZ [Azospirillum melinis]NUB02839.1 sulfoxide reductase heme-binding subunit YedZ [Azospirillum melinis]